LAKGNLKAAFTPITPQSGVEGAFILIHAPDRVKRTFQVLKSSETVGSTIAGW
jgi:hypothetical protein